MTELRVLNVIVWAGVLIYMIPSAWPAVRGVDMRRGDPMRLACAATAFVMLGFVVRWLIAPQDMLSWAALYVLSAALGVYIVLLARAYGRGPRV